MDASRIASVSNTFCLDHIVRCAVLFAALIVLKNCRRIRAFVLLQKNQVTNATQGIALE